ncbi:unnamed protein product [Phytomonas sp. Hart1]|nr:unnamed protein product [Phytomonas sp. Hart1]|eukprot:CCW70777.1 unnamed protein product [Phytomonas sp. isolate Hart1]
MDNNNNDAPELRSQAANSLREELRNLRIQNQHLDEAVKTDEMRLSARNDRLFSLRATCATLERKRKSLLKEKHKNLEVFLQGARELSQSKFFSPATHLPPPAEVELASCQYLNHPPAQSPRSPQDGEAPTNMNSVNKNKMRKISNQLRLLREENAELARRASDYGNRADMIDRSLSIGHLSAQVKASRDKQMLSVMKKQAHVLRNSIKFLTLKLNNKVTSKSEA